MTKQKPKKELIIERVALIVYGVLMAALAVTLVFYLSAE